MASAVETVNSMIRLLQNRCEEESIEIIELLKSFKTYSDLVKNLPRDLKLNFLKQVANSSNPFCVFCIFNRYPEINADSDFELILRRSQAHHLTHLGVSIFNIKYGYKNSRM